MKEAEQNWQTSSSLKECVQQMYQNHLETGDVTFKVGEDGAEVKAHTFILICRSSVFFSMINGKQGSQKRTLKVHDVTKDVFLQFLEFLYTDITDVTEENFGGLMGCAKKYEVELLSALCKTSLKKFINPGIVCKIMEYARLHNDQEITDICLNTVEANTPNFLFTPFFLEMCSSCVHQIMHHDRIFAPEEDIFERVLEWSSEECRRQNSPITAKKQRKVLGNILYGVRFPIMDRKYVDSVICGSDVLNDKDKIEILRQQLDLKEEKAKRFKIRKRVWQPTYVMRACQLGGIMNPSKFKGNEFGLTFKVSSYSVLIGVCFNIHSYKELSVRDTTLHGRITTTKAVDGRLPTEEFSIAICDTTKNVTMLFPDTLIPLEGDVEYTLLFRLDYNQVNTALIYSGSVHFEYKSTLGYQTLSENVEFNGKTCSLYNSSIYSYDHTLIGGLLLT